MILPDINHKMAIYKDCILGEMMAVTLATLLMLLTLFATLTKILFGYGFIGCMLALVFLVHTTRFFLGRLQKLKFGKPYGYYRHWLLKKTSQSFLATLLPLPFVQRIGKWSVRRECND